MNKEEIKELARQEFINNVMSNLDSALIFTYIQKLEQENKELKANRDKATEYIEHLKEYPFLERYYVIDLLKVLKGE